MTAAALAGSKAGELVVLLAGKRVAMTVALTAEWMVEMMVR
jgi:hypothetical protein